MAVRLQVSLTLVLALEFTGLYRVGHRVAPGQRIGVGPFLPNTLCRVLEVLPGVCCMDFDVVLFRAAFLLAFFWCS